MASPGAAPRLQHVPGDRVDADPTRDLRAPMLWFRFRV